MLLVSHAPLDKLQAYRRRMGWSVPWVSDGDSGFNADYGFSAGDELIPLPDGGNLPPIVAHNAEAAGAIVAANSTVAARIAGAIAIASKRAVEEAR